MSNLDPKPFIGMSKKSAQNLAESRNFIFRLVSVDKEKFLGYPPETEAVSDRICVEIENGKVVVASFR